MRRFSTIQTRHRVMMVVISCMIFVGFGAHETQARETEQDYAITAQTVVDLINTERVGQGIEILKEDESLNAVAQKKLTHMLENGYFDHTAPSGADAWEWFFEEGYDFLYAGENLATGFSDADAQHHAWMESPAHKKNILDARFTHTGVAIGVRKGDSQEEIVTVQVFATPQAVMLTSTNFTPQTFEVPQELIRANVADNEMWRSRVSANGVVVAHAEKTVDTFDDHVQFKTDYTHKQIFAWSVLGMILVAIIITEYYLLMKRYRREQRQH